ncbi:MAG TPA: helix-turn-helix transcriptional regulator [Acidimicrobiales bacterium]|jgi:hypothetical protein
MARQSRSDDQRALGASLVGVLVSARLGPPERTQAAIASEANVPLDTLRKLEHRPPADPGFFLVARLARVLGLSLDRLANEMVRHADR